jgi:hypothetical protein
LGEYNGCVNRAKCIFLEQVADVKYKTGVQETREEPRRKQGGDREERWHRASFLPTDYTDIWGWPP